MLTANLANKATPIKLKETIGGTLEQISDSVLIEISGIKFRKTGARYAIAEGAVKSEQSFDFFGTLPPKALHHKFLLTTILKQENQYPPDRQYLRVFYSENHAEDEEYSFIRQEFEASQTALTNSGETKNGTN